MKRRTFITLLGATVSWPPAARAQSEVPVIGFLSSLSSDYASYLRAAFRQGVTESGFAEGHGVKYEYRYANGDYSLLATMTDELVRRRVAVIAAGAPPAALAAKAATSTIPIVFVVGFDPIEAKLVKNYNRPGGNVTGVHLITSPLGQKRLELILELVPNARTINMLVNPTFPDTEIEIRDVQAAAIANRRQLRSVNASTVVEIDEAFAAIADQRGVEARPCSIQDACASRCNKSSTAQPSGIHLQVLHAKFLHHSVAQNIGIEFAGFRKFDNSLGDQLIIRNIAAVCKSKS